MDPLLVRTEEAILLVRDMVRRQANMVAILATGPSPVMASPTEEAIHRKATGSRMAAEVALAAVAEDQVVAVWVLVARRRSVWVVVCSVV